MPLRVVAIIAAYNEEDIIGQVVRALVDDGIKVYFIDHESTDGTLSEVERYRNRGVIGLETFSGAKGPGRKGHRFTWEAILRRKEEIAESLDADWFIHHDADEFRESPWPNETLADGIGRVDAAGFNAIDFEVLNFKPTSEDLKSSDIRKRMVFYEPPGAWDRVQIKCWKKTGSPVSLAASGGHNVEFVDRRVCPVRFVLRHYPIRSQAHGERKVFKERQQQFEASERARGWHVQYDAFGPGTSFLGDVKSLERYDGDAVRWRLLLGHRGVERLQRVVLANQEIADRLTDQIAEVRQHLGRQDAELERIRAERQVFERELEERTRHIERLDTEIASTTTGREAREREIAALQKHLAVQDAELALLRDGRSHLVAERDRADAERDRALSDRDRTAVALETAQRRAEAGAASVERLRRERERLRAEIETLRGTVLSQDVVADGLRRDLAQTRQDLDARNTTIEYVLASRSWRMTAALRALDRFARGRASETTGRGLALANFPLSGGLRLRSDVSGFWGDGWSGPELRFRIHVDDAVRAIAIAGRVPAGMHDGQDLSLEAAGRTWTLHAAPGPFQWTVDAGFNAGDVVDLRITAKRTWRPSAAGASTDERDLAWGLVSIAGKR